MSGREAAAALSRSTSRRQRPAHDPIRRALALILALLVGCASSPESELTQTEWGEVQALAVIPSPEPTEVNLWVLDAKTGAGVGAMKAVEIANVVTMGLWVLAFYGAGAVCVPLLGAGIGVVVGAIKAPSDEEMRQIQETLFDVVTTGCLPQAIQKDFIERGTKKSPGRRFLALDAVPGEDAKARASRLREQGIDAALEVAIETIEVSGPWGTAPFAALEIQTRFRIISTEDGTILLQGTHRETAEAKDIGGWWLEPSTENPDPTLSLRSRLALAARKTGAAIANAVLLGTPPRLVPRADPASQPAE